MTYHTFTMAAAIAVFGVTMSSAPGVRAVASETARAIPSTQADSAKAQDLFEQGKTQFFKPGAKEADQAAALKLLFQAADLGNSDAMETLGAIFGSDPRIADMKQSFSWDLKAAEAGDGLSMTRVGNDYVDGRGVAKDAAKGVEWYRKAIAAGSAAGMNGLAGAYQNGWGVKQDINMAVSWYQKAADSGHPQASFMLGVSYLTGQGHPADPQKAADYIYAALRKGYQQALTALLNTPKPNTDFAKALQRHLIADKFLTGAADGVFGSMTFGALKAAFGTVSYEPK